MLIFKVGNIVHKFHASAILWKTALGNWGRAKNYYYEKNIFYCIDVYAVGDGSSRTEECDKIPWNTSGWN